MTEVSNERLAAMLNAEVPLGMSVADARSILTELQTHRRSPSLSGGEVERYEPFANEDDGEFTGMKPWVDGEWIKFSSHTAVIAAKDAEIERLTRRLNGDDRRKRIFQRNVRLRLEAESNLKAAEARANAAVEALRPFAELPLAEKHRHFAQVLICPEGDDAEHNWAPKIKAARAALASLNGAKP